MEPKRLEVQTSGRHAGTAPSAPVTSGSRALDLIPGGLDLGTAASGSLAITSLFFFFSCFKDSDYNVILKI